MSHSIFDGPLHRILPSHTFNEEELLAVGRPEEPAGYDKVWREWYAEALEVETLPEVIDTGQDENGWRVFDIIYTSTDQMVIGGWLLLPKSGVVKRGLVVGHGYSGRDEASTCYPFKDTAILFPCARGISRSPNPPISHEPKWHVLHDIDKPERYIMRGCVEDTWLAVSALLRLFPQLEGRIGYIGVSFGGGVGAMALAWDDRVSKAYLNVPSFGNQEMRLKLRSLGSAASVQSYNKKEPDVVENTLQWYDAATAANRITIPMLVACALSDPVVTPPGQFAVYNALQGPKELFVLDGGHKDYPNKKRQDSKIWNRMLEFFEDL